MREWVSNKKYREKAPGEEDRYLKRIRTRIARKDDNSEDSLRGTKLKRKNVGKMHRETFKFKAMYDRAV
jgi:hypothetical protein